jgi:hypothetical protein
LTDVSQFAIDIPTENPVMFGENLSLSQIGLGRRLIIETIHGVISRCTYMNDEDSGCISFESVALVLI